MPEPPLEELIDHITQITDEKALRTLQCLCQMQLAIASQLNDGQFIDWRFTKP